MASSILRYKHISLEWPQLSNIFHCGDEDEVLGSVRLDLEDIVIMNLYLPLYEDIYI